MKEETSNRRERCPSGCGATLVERIGGRWCPRCKGWVAEYHRPGDNIAHAFVSRPPA